MILLSEVWERTPANERLISRFEPGWKIAKSLITN